jgi:hypothetical protein
VRIPLATTNALVAILASGSWLLASGQAITPGSTAGPTNGNFLSPGASFTLNRVALIDALGKIGAVAGPPGNCVLVNGASTACGSGGNGNSTLWPNFAGGETPGQTSTLVYTLAHTPDPAPLLQLYVNGLLMQQGVDYTLSGSTITFTSDYSTLLATSQVMVANYQFGIQSAGSTAFLTAITNLAMLFAASASASGTAYTGCPLDPALQLSTGMTINWVPDVNGTGGATTFNLCGLGAVALKEADGATNPTSTDAVAGKLYAIWYDGTVWRLPASGGGVVYPGAGVACSTGSGWCASYAVGTGNNDLVQLTAAGKLPAVDGSLLTNLPAAGAYAVSQPGTGNIAQTGSAVQIYSQASVPALAAGACYEIRVEYNDVSAGNHTTYLYVDASAVATLSGSGAIGGTGYTRRFWLTYCNAPASQTSQVITQYDVSYANTGGGGWTVDTGWTGSPTATGVNWASPHAIQIYTNAASGNMVGMFFRVGQ